MDDRFPDEFVTWVHKTLVGVKVNEVFGMDSKSGKVWRELALQIYSEENEGDYRVIEHFENGVPFLDGYPGRISVTHTNHLLAVASLPKTPEVSLEKFSPRTAMGIDAESLNRQQVLNVRTKFLSDEELKLIPENNLEANILAWTAKEALYKAALCESIDYKEGLCIKTLPRLLKDPIKGGIKDLGEGEIKFPDATGLLHQSMKLFAYESYGCAVTIAVSPQSAKFGKPSMT